MGVLYILFGLILVLILWIVFVPVYVRIDTDLNQYEVSQAATVKITFDPHDERRIRVRIFGFNLRKSKKQKKPSAVSTVKKNKAPFKRSISTWLFLMKGVKESFKVNRLVLTMDLDDVVLSAKMIPILIFLNNDVVSLSTNFRNRYYFSLETETRMNKILWTFFLFYIKK